MNKTARKEKERETPKQRKRRGGQEKAKIGRPTNKS